MGYAKEIYHLAQQELDRRREHAQRTAAQHRDELNEKIPELRQIERELASTGLDAARAAILGKEDTAAQIEALRVKNLSLQKRRGELLMKAGFSADFLAVHYTCEKCQDTGFVAQTRCTCMEQLLQRLAYERVSDGSGIENCRFDNFYLDYYSAQPGEGGRIPRRVMEKILRSCREYAQGFSAPPKANASESLLFRGNTGLGKTHLSLSIAYEVIQKGFGVYYASCQRLMDRLQTQQFHRDPTDSTDYLQMALGCDLLVLDDLGAEFSTSFSIAALQNLINTRLVENRPTIISTNLDTQQLGDRYGERVVSRLLCAYQPYPFCGEDIRKQKRYQAL